MRVISVSNQFVRWTKGIATKYNLKPEDKFPILSTPAANICMKKTLNKIEIKDAVMFSIHNIRKTLETWLIALDIDSLKIVKHFGHSIDVASKFYVSPDTFNYEDRRLIREIIGDLYFNQRI
jgi:integrase